MAKRTEMSLKQLEHWLAAIRDLKRGYDPRGVVQSLRRQEQNAHKTAILADEPIRRMHDHLLNPKK